MTSRAAFDRLFNETMTALRFEVAGEPEPLPLEPTLNLLVNPDRARRQAGAEALAKEFTDEHAALYADHQYARQGQGDFRPLARLQGRGRQPASRQPGRSRRSSRHWSPRCARPTRGFPIAITGSRPKWLGLPRLATWDRNAPLPEQPERVVTWPEAEALVLEAYGGFAPQMAEIARRFFANSWIDAPVRIGKSPAPSRIRPCPRCIPTSS